MENFTVTSGALQSPWLEPESTLFGSLQSHLHTEICVIGAGMAGLSVAYQLASLGKKVVVIEAGQIGSGETGRTTAHLTNAFDDRYHQVIALHGIEHARLVAQSHTEAINYIEKIVTTEAIACDFSRVDGYLFLAPGQDKKILEDEKKAAHAVGIAAVDFCSTHPIKGLANTATLRFADQAQFHPLKYLAGLAQAIVNKQGAIYTHTRAMEMLPGKKVTIKTEQGFSITADQLVIATNAPIFDKSFSFLKQTANRTFAIGSLIARNSLPHALYWDTATPYHYVRLHPYNTEQDLLIIGGEDRRTGYEEEKAFDNLEYWGRKFFSELKKVDFHWSGQIQEPADYLAFIGRLPTKNNNLYSITGDSGNGITHGAIAAMLISDLITGNANPWEKVYSPKRSGLKNKKAFFKHNLQTIKSYLPGFTPDKVKSVDELKPGQGAIIKKGRLKQAIYRDEKNRLHVCQAVCSHMNAPLQWNPVEKSWDCPAHGSRFAPCGKVLQGPAVKPLKVMRNSEA